VLFRFFNGSIIVLTIFRNLPVGFVRLDFYLARWGPWGLPLIRLVLLLVCDFFRSGVLAELCVFYLGCLFRGRSSHRGSLRLRGKVLFCFSPRRFGRIASVPFFHQNQSSSAVPAFFPQAFPCLSGHAVLSCCGSRLLSRPPRLREGEQKDDGVVVVGAIFY